MKEFDEIYGFESEPLELEQKEASVEAETVPVEKPEVTIDLSGRAKPKSDGETGTLYNETVQKKTKEKTISKIHK